jgi:hypothetical protein
MKNPKLPPKPKPARKSKRRRNAHRPKLTRADKADAKSLFQDPIFMHHFAGAIMRYLELTGLDFSRPLPTTSAPSLDTFEAEGGDHAEPNDRD